jgi:hypothetical protein
MFAILSIALVKPTTAAPTSLTAMDDHNLMTLTTLKAKLEDQGQAIKDQGQALAAVVAKSEKLEAQGKALEEALAYATGSYEETVAEQAREPKCVYGSTTYLEKANGVLCRLVKPRSGTEDEENEETVAEQGRIGMCKMNGSVLIKKKDGTKCKLFKPVGSEDEETVAEEQQTYPRCVFANPDRPRTFAAATVRTVKGPQAAKGQVFCALVPY